MRTPNEQQAAAIAARGQVFVSAGAGTGTSARGIDIGQRKKKQESPLTSSVQENFRGFTYHGESVVPAAAGMLGDARGGVDEDAVSPHEEEEEVNTDDELADERPVGRYARRRDDEDHLDGFDEDLH